ncbi:MAG TPA: DUF2461 domain-containing protein [Chitinophagaceae bacterium]
MLQVATLKFLKGLKKNNNKPWFDAHRDNYDNARKDFEIFIQAVIDAHSKKDPDLKNLTAKNCLFRINRDVRFAKDKSPYKKNFAASMDKGGKKSGLAGYYFHLEPGNSFMGAGIWQPEPSSLKNIRQEIDYNADEFHKIINSTKFKKTFKGLYTGEDVQLKKIPHGFEKDNPAAEYLKFKSWMVLQELTDEEILSNTLLKKTLDAFALAQPFIKFLNRPLE